MLPVGCHADLRALARSLSLEPSKGKQDAFHGNSSVFDAGRDVLRSWGELTPIELAQEQMDEARFFMPLGVCDQRASGPQPVQILMVCFLVFKLQIPMETFDIYRYLAEAVRFELTEDSHPRRFSRPVP